jgi:hypothetical protein
MCTFKIIKKTLVCQAVENGWIFFLDCEFNKSTWAQIWGSCWPIFERYYRIKWPQALMARLLRQQSSITVDRLPTKENKLPFPFAANKQKFDVSLFHLQQTNGSCRFFSSVFCLQKGVKGSGFLAFLGSQNLFRIIFYLRRSPQDSVCKIPRNSAKST